MKQLFLIFFFLLAILQTHAQLLWKVSANPSDKPSFIMGTHHLASFSILENIEGLWPAFKSVEQVYGEIALQEFISPETMLIMQSAMLMANDTTLKTLYREEQFEVLNSFTKEKMGMDLNNALTLKPAAIMAMVSHYLHLAHTANHQPDQQLDIYFQQKAHESGKKTGGLETVAFQVDLLYNSPLSRQAELLLCTVNDLEAEVEMIKSLNRAYLAQNLEELLRLMHYRHESACDYYPEELEKLNDSRNRAWIALLPDIMKGGSTFFAVGAMHLPGDNGILQLLRQNGYTVEPVK